MPDCHEHPFDHTECVHGGHDWCYHCAEELTKAANLERCNLNAQLQEAVEARDRRTAILKKIHGFVTSGLGGKEPSLYEMRILEMIQVGLGG